MGLAVAGLHTLQCHEFGKDEGQQATAVQLHKSLARHRTEQNLIELVGNAFAADDADALLVAFQGLEGLIINIEAQLRSEAHAAHHAQGIVAKGDVGIKRRTDGLVIEVVDTSKGIDQFTQSVGIETDSQGIDGKVAAILVIVQRSILHHGLT